MLICSDRENAARTCVINILEARNFSGVPRLILVQNVECRWSKCWTVCDTFLKIRNFNREELHEKFTVNF